MLIDALAKDAHAILGALDGRELPSAVEQAAAVLAVVVGQDLDADADGVFRIARKVSKDRMISTVDPDARHGRKTSSRGFDGYKGHVALDPGSEFITATTVTAGNAGEGQEVAGLLAEDLAEADDPAGEDEPAASGTATEPLSAYGDSAYGTGSVLDTLENVGANILCKVKAPVAPAGRFTKDDFRIDMELGTVVCPAGRTAWLREVKGGQVARFGSACQSCPLFAQCTTGSTGPTIGLGPHEQHIARGRERQTDPGVAGRLHSDPPEDRAEDRSSDATPTRRTPCPCPRSHKGERRLQSPRSHSQPRTPRNPRVTSHNGQIAATA